MKIQTINQLVSVWKDIATRHYQINGFGIGDNWENGTNEKMHPVLWINPTNASMPSSDNGYKTFEIDFEVRLFDLVNKDESNENDVLSDTIDILKDIIAEFKGHPYYVNSQLNIIGDIDFEAFTEEFDEEVSGWTCEISLMTPVLTTFCGIPATDITGFEFPGVDCPDVNVLCPVFVEDVTGVYPIVVNTVGTTKEISIVGGGLSDTFVISGNYNDVTDNLELLRNDGVTVLTDLSSVGGGVDTNTFLLSGSFDNSTNDLELTLNSGAVVTVNLDDLKDNTDTNTIVSSGVVNGNDLTLTMDDSSTVVVDVTSLALDTNTDTNTFLSSTTFNDSNDNNLIETLSDGTTVTTLIDNFDDLTVNGTVDATAFIGDGSGLTGLASGGGDNLSNTDLTQADQNRRYTLHSTNPSILTFEGVNGNFHLQDDMPFKIFTGSDSVASNVRFELASTSNGGAMAFNNNRSSINSVSDDLIIKGHLQTGLTSKIELGASLLINTHSTRALQLQSNFTFFQSSAGTYYGTMKGGSFIWGAINLIGSEGISLQKDTLVKGSDTSNSTTGFKVTDSTNASLLEVKNNGVINASNLPTSSAGLSSGDIWNNSGVLNIV